MQQALYSRGYAGVPYAPRGEDGFSSDIITRHIWDQEKYWHMVWLVVSLAEMTQNGPKWTKKGPKMIKNRFSPDIVVSYIVGKLIMGR